MTTARRVARVGTVVVAGVLSVLLVAAAFYAAYRLIGPASYVLAQQNRALGVLAVAVAPVAVLVFVRVVRFTVTARGGLTPRWRNVVVWAARGGLLVTAVFLGGTLFQLSIPNNGQDALGADVSVIVRPASALLFAGCLLGLYGLHRVDVRSTPPAIREVAEQAAPFIGEIRDRGGRLAGKVTWRSIVLAVIGVVVRAVLLYAAVLLSVEAIEVVQEYVVFGGDILWGASERELSGLLLGIGGCVFGLLLLPSPWRLSVKGGDR